MKFTPDQVSFTRGEIRAILAHAGADPYRANLHGAYLDLACGRLWASDGSTLAVCAKSSDAIAVPPDGAPVLVPRALLGVAARFHVGRFAVKDGTLEWSGWTRAMARDLEVDARTLPSASLRVLPATPPSPIDYAVVLGIARTTGDGAASRVGYAPARLAGLAALRDAGVVALRTRTPTSPTAPLVAEAKGHGGCAWLALVMPYRLEDCP